MHRDECVAHRGQQPSRHRRAAQVGPGTPLRGNYPGKQNRAILDFAGSPFDNIGDNWGVAELNPGFDTRLFGTMPHHGGIGAFAPQQTKSRHHHGFAGTGFAGDDREAGTELLPEQFGPWQSVWERHHRWSLDGTYVKVFAAVSSSEADGSDDVLELISIDSTSVRAHQHAAGARPARDPLTGGKIELQDIS